MTSTVSLIIPTFNANAFIADCIESALSQSIAPHEVILIDDASTDDTLATLRSHEQRHPSIKVLAQLTNSGPAACRNLGIAHASGEYIAFLDADDRLHVDHIASLLDVIGKQGAQIASADIAYSTDGRTKINSSGFTQVARSGLITLDDFLTHAVPSDDSIDWGLMQPMIERQFLLEHDLKFAENVRHGEDFLLYFQLLQAGASWYFSFQDTYICAPRSAGTSRTQVNYRGMVEMTRQLANDRALILLPQQRDLLHRRANTLQRFQVESTRHRLRMDAVNAINQKDLLQILIGATGSVTFLREILRQIGIRIGIRRRIDD